MGRSPLTLPSASLCTLWLPDTGLPSSRKVMAEEPENLCPVTCKTVPRAPAGVAPTLYVLVILIVGSGLVRRYAARPTPLAATTTVPTRAIMSHFVTDFPATFVAEPRACRGNDPWA